MHTEISVVLRPQSPCLFHVLLAFLVAASASGCTGTIPPTDAYDDDSGSPRPDSSKGGAGPSTGGGGVTPPETLKPPTAEEQAKARDEFDKTAKPLPGTKLPVPLEPVAFVDPAVVPLQNGCGKAASYNLAAANRRPPVDGLPDWSLAGYQSGKALPKGAAVVDATDHGVVPNDGKDDSARVQAAIDAAAKMPRGYGQEAVVRLPAGQILLSREIKVHASHLIIAGQGAHPHETGSTQIVVRPGKLMAYDQLSADGSEPRFQDVEQDDGNGGWLWPGRGAFRVQTTAVHEDYRSDYENADPSWRDIFEGTVNVHWKNGLVVDQSAALAGRLGASTLRIDKGNTRAALQQLVPGALVQVVAANSLKMYQAQGVVNPLHHDNNYMRMQLFTLKAYDAGTRTVTLDRPLEFDVPANSTSDGSKVILSKERESKVIVINAVQDVGFENFFLTYDIAGLPKINGGTYDLHPADAHLNYGNIAPEYALHGIVFKWAAHSWIRGVRMYMIGSHPVVTEVAQHIQVEGNAFEGSWNKGKGGNGYLRGSRVWNSLYAGNVSRGLRHFTFQWSASGNVMIGNDLDSDINFHGGWERHNLVELNVVNVPFRHASGSCLTNCGGESDGQEPGTWWPLWWGAGAKSGKWSGASGPQNVLFRNTLKKQTAVGGEFAAYAPYFQDDGRVCNKIWQLAWDRSSAQGSRWVPLSINDKPIADWLSHERADFSRAQNAGVNGERVDNAPSLFLMQ